jgi:hypothetical protein
LIRCQRIWWLEFEKEFIRFLLVKYCNISFPSGCTLKKKDGVNVVITECRTSIQFVKNESGHCNCFLLIDNDMLSIRDWIFTLVMANFIFVDNAFYICYIFGLFDSLMYVAVTWRVKLSNVIMFRFRSSKNFNFRRYSTI